MVAEIARLFPALPVTLNVEPGVRRGRVPRDGYLRGWGLQFGELLAFVQNEPLYAESLSGIGLKSWITPKKRANIYLIITRFLDKLADRNIIEFGSFQGGTAIFMARVLRRVAPEAKVYALDTYGGMPPTDRSIDAHSPGDFSDASYDALCRRIEELGLGNLVPVKGLFQDTFPSLAPGERFGLAHIDADIYSAIKYAQDATWPRMTTGGYVVYDDAEVSSCIGATQAVEELIQERRARSEQVWPHFVFRVGLEG
jgi:predicted O-methyltransferase YrrM